MVKNIKNQKGVSLIITLFIMIIILAVVLSISTLLYSEIKVLRNVGNSVAGLYAADSGIEKVLYYDRQYKPNNGITCIDSTTCPPAFPSCDEITKKCSMIIPRGLCSMFLNSVGVVNSCSSGSESINCNSGTLVTGDTNKTEGCKPDVCDDCTIDFKTTLNGGLSPTNYSTTARVYADAVANNFEISSKGDFSGASRRIEISIKSEIGVTINNFSAACDKISVAVTPTDPQYRVVATIEGPTTVTSSLNSGGQNIWSGPWPTYMPVTGQQYAIYVTVTDKDSKFLGRSNTITFTCNL